MRLEDDDSTAASSGATILNLQRWRSGDNPSRSEMPTEVTGLPRQAAGTEPDLQPGDRVGAFLIIRRLGEGGMGVVYLAEQVEPVARTVALKLVRRQLLGGISEAYFEVERQVLARMSHPAVATVYEAGTTPQGYPYFAMQWIDGVALDAWHARQPAGLRVRLQLMMAIAHGVQHAHQRGIVHRDLKPSNILVERVDGQARPRIIDFGIAQGVHARTPGVLAGTGCYMSPEQRRAEACIDERSDIYALGMLLLTLLLPAADVELLSLGADGALHAELLQSLRRRAHPSADGRLLARIPRELRFVLARALAPERDQRYESAHAFAEELQRFLSMRPLQAVPQTRRYRLGKFLRRHRLPLFAASAVLVALLAGLSAALLALRKAEAEAQKSSIVAEFLTDVLAGVDPEQARSMDKTLMRLVLDSAAARAQTRLAQQPVLLSAVESVIGKSYDGLGESERAIRFQQSAYQRLVEQRGPADAETLALGRAYARTLAGASRTAEAAALVDTLYRTARTSLGASAAETLRLASTQAWVLRELGKLAEARALLESTLTTQTILQTSDSDDALDTRYALAIVLTDLNDTPAAESSYVELIRAREQRDGLDHPRTLALRNSLGVVYLNAGRNAEAESLYRVLLPQYERVLGPLHPETLGVTGNLAAALAGQGLHAQAGPYFERTLTGMRERFGDEHPWTLFAWAQLGAHRLALADPEAALAAYETARTGAGKLLNEQHPVRLNARAGWARAAAALGQLAAAQAEIESTLSAARKTYPDGHPELRAIEQTAAEIERLQSPAVAAPSG